MSPGFEQCVFNFFAWFMGVSTVLLVYEVGKNLIDAVSEAREARDRAANSAWEETVLRNKENWDRRHGNNLDWEKRDGDE